MLTLQHHKMPLFVICGTQTTKSKIIYNSPLPNVKKS